MKVKARHTTAKAMPAVARMEKMTVRERCTDTSFSIGTPSYGGSPPGRWRVMGELEEVGALFVMVRNPLLLMMWLFV